MAFLNAVRDVIGGGVFAPLVYALIVFVFVIGLVKCVLPVLNNRSHLRRAIHNIRAGADAKHSWQEDDFLGKGVLNSHWSEYLNNLFFADGVYHNASNVEDYINEETVIFGPGRGSFADAIPGLLVSLGFLGTLVGLAQGLSGFKVEDAGSMMSSITTLIPGMRYAFTTSIFGVIGSLLFTFVTRMAHGSTERTLRTFYGAMSRYAGVLSVDPMTQVAIYQQEQTMLIKKLSEDLSGKLTDNVAEAVARSVEPLNQSMKNFVTVSTREQMRFLDAVVSRFVERMNDTLGGRLSRFAQILEETNRNQEDAVRGVKEGLADAGALLGNVREVARICDQMVRANAEYIDALRDNRKQTDEAYLRVASSVEKMDLVTKQQANYLKSVNAMQSDVTRSIEQLNQNMQSYMQRMSEQGSDATSGMMRAAAELRATGEQLRDISGDFTAAITREMQGSLDGYHDYLKQFTEWLNKLAGAFDDTLGKLPGEVANSGNRLLDEVDRLTESLAGARRDAERTER